MIDEQYWREFAIKFARKRGVSNPEVLIDISQDAIVKIQQLDLTRLKSQKEVERFVGRSVANMIRDWQKKERLRTHAQLYEFTDHLHSTANIEDCFADYLDSVIPAKVKFNNGQDAVVDNRDFQVIEQSTWHITNVGDRCYIRTWLNGRHQYLHRVIAARAVKKIPKNSTVNFLNGNTLDCRRANLAIGNIPLIEA